MGCCYFDHLYDRTQRGDGDGDDWRQSPFLFSSDQIDISRTRCVFCHFLSPLFRPRLDSRNCVKGSFRISYSIPPTIRAYVGPVPDTHVLRPRRHVIRRNDDEFLRGGTQPRSRRTGIVFDLQRRHGHAIVESDVKLLKAGCEQICGRNLREAGPI